LRRPDQPAGSKRGHCATRYRSFISFIERLVTASRYSSLDQAPGSRPYFFAEELRRAEDRSVSFRTLTAVGRSRPAFGRHVAQEACLAEAHAVSSGRRRSASTQYVPADLIRANVCIMIA